MTGMAFFVNYVNCSSPMDIRYCGHLTSIISYVLLQNTCRKGSSGMSVKNETNLLPRRLKPGLL